MKRGNYAIVLLAFVFLLFLAVGNAEVSIEKVNSEVLQDINENGSAEVIIIVNESFEERGIFSFGMDDVDKVRSSDESQDLMKDGFTTTLDHKTLESLIDEKKVLSIEPIREFEIKLTESVPLINGTNVWKLKSENLNLTGLNQTICVIDTGVDFTNPDLTGKNLSCNVYCDPDGSACQENCSVTDLNGHGTHVAGISSANGSLKGVAPDSKIVSVKIFPGSGISGATTVNLKNAIDWCINNSEIYGIKAISLSLGTNTHYSATCDAAYPSLATSFADADVKNISVVVASGNEENYTGISSPACLTAAIPVSSIYDEAFAIVTWGATCTDTNVNVDDFVCSANRNSLIKLLAPGAMINSTYLDTYDEIGGTSMATPHVSGAILLLNQYLSLTGRTKTAKQLEAVLNNTGKIIYDSASGNNYSRINVYDAILNLDIDNPNVTLVSPNNDTYISSSNQTFICNASDLSLKNVTLYIWNDSGIYFTSSQSLSSQTNQFEVNVTNISVGNYRWNCLYYDEAGNGAFASSNRTFSWVKQVILFVVDGLNAKRFGDLLASGNLTNFSRIINGNGINTTLNITKHSQTETKPGNAELHSGLNESVTNITDNSDGNILPTGNSSFDRIKSGNSEIITGSIYGKNTAYIPLILLNYSLYSGKIDWWQNRTSYTNTNWPDGTACTYPENVSTKATEFIANYSNRSFYLVVYMGTPDCTGHVYKDNSSQYNNSIIAVDNALGILINSLQTNGLYGTNNVTKIIISADHGWNLNSSGHGTVNADTLVLPLVSNDYSLVNGSTINGIKEQCEIAPTILSYLGVNSNAYLDIIRGGCEPLTVDSASPTITITNPVSTTYENPAISMNLGLNELGKCNYSIDGGLNNYSLNTSDFTNFDGIVDVSPGSYTLSYYCLDLGGNRINQSVAFTYTPASSVAASSGGGGGGGGGGANTIVVATYVANLNQQNEYSKELSVGDVIKFDLIENGNSANHNITVDKILENTSVQITIRSTPIVISLGIGESKKLDLNLDRYFDILIKLNNITGKRANLTIEKIYEEIPQIEKQSNSSEIVENKTSVEENVEKKGNLWIVLIGLFLVALIFWVIFNRIYNGRVRRRNLSLINHRLR